MLTAFFFEVGAALIVVPWSTFWDRNYFAQAVPLVHAFITSNFVRGAVSGLGLLNIVAGVRELVSMLMARRVTPPRGTVHVPSSPED